MEIRTFNRDAGNGATGNGTTGNGETEDGEIAKGETTKEELVARWMKAESVAGWLNLGEFRSALRAGAFSSIRVIGDGTSFSVQGIGKIEKARREFGTTFQMKNCRGEGCRRFRSPNAVLRLLKDLGACKVEFDVERWLPKCYPLDARKRPDVSERHRRLRTDLKGFEG